MNYLGAIALAGGGLLLGLRMAKRPPAAPYRIVSQIFEPDGVGWAYPVVEHIFNGRTPDEAQRYFNAHLKSDAFFRGCLENQCFDSSVACREFHARQVWGNGRWV